jgi:hypothetical protein
VQSPGDWPKIVTLVLPEVFAHRFDQSVEVGDELLDRHGRFGSVALVRCAVAALVPETTVKFFLERRMEVTACFPDV